MSESIISQEFQGFSIQQRTTDGYVDATAMCKATGKDFYDYSRLKTTAKFLEVLSIRSGITGTGLVQVFQGGNDYKLQGTWVHPQVAINLGQWCSPEFAVFVSQLVFEWMDGKRSLEIAALEAKFDAKFEAIASSLSARMEPLEVHRKELIARMQEDLWVNVIDKQDEIMIYVMGLREQVKMIREQLRQTGNQKPAAKKKAVTKNLPYPFTGEHTTEYPENYPE